MKKVFIVTLCLIMAMTCSLTLVSCMAVKMPTDERFNDSDELWNVAFFDEFKGDKLDTTRWRINTFSYNNNQRRGGYYTDHAENVFVKDDALTIRTNYRTSQYGTGWHTSWVESATDGDSAIDGGYNGFSQKQGYFEIKCKVPRAVGVWSAFWMMPDEGVGLTENDIMGTATDGVEIDIMESFAWNYRQSYTQHVVHADGYGAEQKSEHSQNFKIKDMYNTFHTYAVEWAEDKYTFYIDGYKTWESQHTINGASIGISDVLQYMIMSVEIAGDSEKGWAGDPAKNKISGNYDFVIDHIKVMERK